MKQSIKSVKTVNYQGTNPFYYFDDERYESDDDFMGTKTNLQLPSYDLPKDDEDFVPEEETTKSHVSPVTNQYKLRSTSKDDQKDVNDPPSEVFTSVSVQNEGNVNVPPAEVSTSVSVQNERDVNVPPAEVSTNVSVQNVGDVNDPPTEGSTSDSLQKENITVSFCLSSPKFLFLITLLCF